MPPRQTLIGLWLLLTGICLFAGLGLAMYLATTTPVEASAHWPLWLLSLLPAFILLLGGILLERRLLAPLRQLQVLLARLVASPDADRDYPLAGWLATLQADLDQVRSGWRQDRQTLVHAKEESARSTRHIREALEALVQTLDTPVLICDAHQRLLLFNHAAEALLSEQTHLSLGRSITAILPYDSLKAALDHLTPDQPGQSLLLPGEQHWLSCRLQPLGDDPGHILLTLQDSTHVVAQEQQWISELSQLLPALRGHAGSLATASEALSQGTIEAEMQSRLHNAIGEESQALGDKLGQLSRLIESHQLSHTRLEDTWSNDLCHALQGRLKDARIQITPIGIPAWVRIDAPSLLPLLEHLLRMIHPHAESNACEIEFLLGNRRVYLDIRWPGAPLSESQLHQWRSRPLFDEPLSPRISDVLAQHGADIWALPADTHDDTSGIRLPLPASPKGVEPRRKTQPRPEFHDFSIAQRPPPTQEQSSLLLGELDLVVFDTETTGLDLKGGDRIISLAGCRILHGRLLADDCFDQKVNPDRPIPAASTAIHGLTDEDVAQAPPIEIVLPRFHRYVGTAVMVAHNAEFDMLALKLAGTAQAFDQPVLDTLLLSRALDPTLETHGLDALAERFELSFPPGTRHTALGDARVTAELLLALLPRLQARGVNTLGDALAFQQQGASA